jgi:anti-sigma B factor antagonist
MDGQDLHWELEESADETGYYTSVVKFHGRIVSSTARDLEKPVKPLIARGGRIILDLTDVAYMDSLGLGALVALKVSAIDKGYCTLQLVNLTPRLMQLLRLTNLLQMFTS